MPPEGSSPATRDIILLAAKRVVQRDGAGHLTLDAVAKEAQVSKGGLLYHFPSKADLLRGLMSQGIAMQNREIAARMPAGAPPGAWTCAFVQHAMFGPVDENCRPPAETVWSMLAAAANDPSLLEPARQMHADWQRKLEADGVAPTVATLLRMVCHGLWSSEIFGFLPPDDAERRRLAELLKGLVRPAAPTSNNERPGESGTGEDSNR